MNRAAFYLACLMGVTMLWNAIDAVLSPYEPAFYRWGGPLVLTIVFAHALIHRRRHRPPAQTPANPPISTSSCRELLV